jgi:hypothetical protein
MVFSTWQQRGRVVSLGVFHRFFDAGEGGGSGCTGVVKGVTEGEEEEEEEEEAKRSRRRGEKEVKEGEGTGTGMQ